MNDLYVISVPVELSVGFERRVYTVNEGDGMAVVCVEIRDDSAGSLQVLGAVELVRETTSGTGEEGACIRNGRGEDMSRDIYIYI